MKLLWVLPLTLLLVAAQWNPAAFADRSTIEFLTVVPEEGEHWSTVWFVVIDGAVYLRLGPRAAGRIEKNSTAPRLQMRVAGTEIYPMRYEKAPEMAAPIAAAMYEKYWSDFLGSPFRRLGLSSPPLMLRLLPDAAASGSRAGTLFALKRRRAFLEKRGDPLAKVGGAGRDRLQIGFVAELVFQ